MSRRNTTGEWIKLGRDLWTHPKVRRIADLMGRRWQPELPLSGADRGGQCADNVRTMVLVHSVVSGLCRTFLTVNRHAYESNDQTMDAILTDIFTDTYIDEVAGLPGLQADMIAVGWAEHDKEKGILRLLDYCKHNALHKGEKRSGRPGNSDSPEAIRKRAARARAKEQAAGAEPPDNGTDNPRTIAPDDGGQKPDNDTEKRRAEQSTLGIESTAPPAPEGALALEADAIATDFPKSDNPLDVRRIILETLQRGPVTAAEMREKVRRCVAAIRQAPGGVGNQFVPKALTFFSEEQWADPEAFEGRWKGKGREPSSRRDREPASAATAQSLPRL